MLFSHPAILGLLLLVPIFAVVSYRTAARRRSLTTFFRTLSLVALILALSRPLLPWQSAEDAHVSVVDCSSAMSDNALQTVVHDIGGLASTAKRPAVIAFASRALVVSDADELRNPGAIAKLRRRLAQPVWADDQPSGGTNLAAALQLAAAQIPRLGRGSINLYAEGWSDHGDAAAEAYRLAERGVAVHVMPTEIAIRKNTSVALQRLLLPATARIGETIDADIQLESTSTGTVTVALTIGNAVPVRATAVISPGSNDVHIPLPLHQPGLIVARATTQPTTADVPGSAADASSATYVEAAPKVLVVQDAPGPGLPRTFGALLGSSVDVTTVSPDQFARESLEEVGTVVLSDLPADRLPIAVQENLRRAVLDGTGLLLAGAARSFGPGGYDASRLAPLLPVRMPQQAMNIDPSTALVLIIDTSGSMKGEKLDLAKQVARLAVSHLRAQDNVGIVEFYGGRRWAAPIQSAADRSVLQRTLDRLTAGGNTTMYPALEEAAFGLRNVHARSKHVMIISDGFVESAPFGELARQMTDDGVAVSAVQVGSDDSANLMPALARWGGGRFYAVRDQFELPDVILKQPEQSPLSSLVETPSAVTAGDDALVRNVVDSAWAPIQAYVRTTAKPTADVLLAASSGDPLLTRWRYGAGFVATLTTQLGSTMTDGLQEQPQFARLLAGLMRQTNSGKGSPLQIQTVVRPAGIEVNVTASRVDAALRSHTLSLTLADETGHAVRVAPSAEPIAPGQWNILLTGITSGVYQLTAAVDQSTVTGRAGVAVPLPESAHALMPNQSLLDQIASFSPMAEERAKQLPTYQTVFIELRKPLAVSAVLMLLLHIAVRRWPAKRIVG